MALFDYVGGYTAQPNNTTSAALPTGSQVGDFVVIVGNYSSSAAVTDPRFAAGVGLGSGRVVAWGVLGSDLSPISVSFVGNVFGHSYGVSAFRQVGAAEQMSATGLVPGNPPPVIPNSLYAVMVVVSAVGTVSGGPSSVPGWTFRQNTWDARRGLGIYSWSAPGGTRQSTPASGLTCEGTNPGLGAVVLRVEDNSPYVEPSTTYLYDEGASLLIPLNAAYPISTSSE